MLPIDDAYAFVETVSQVAAVAYVTPGWVHVRVVGLRTETHKSVAEKKASEDGKENYANLDNSRTSTGENTASHRHAGQIWE